MYSAEFKGILLASLTSIELVVAVDVTVAVDRWKAKMLLNLSILD